MKPAPFRLHRPKSLEEALETLAEVGDEGKVLAGGQSLIPMLNMRLASPAHLVDINSLKDLNAIEANPRGVRIGALARHAEVERSINAAAVVPLLGQALRLVAHPTIRNRGTTVGSLVHADPSGEMTAVLTLLGGEIQLAGKSSHRSLAAGDFFVGPLETSMAPGELAVSAWFPALPARSGTAFHEVSRRHGDYAMCGVAAAVTLDQDALVTHARVSYVSMTATPVAIDLAAVVGRVPFEKADWRAAAVLAGEQLDPEGDIHASEQYRRRVGITLTVRALKEAASRAFGSSSPEEQELAK